MGTERRVEEVLVLRELLLVCLSCPPAPLPHFPKQRSKPLAEAAARGPCRKTRGICGETEKHGVRADRRPMGSWGQPIPLAPHAHGKHGARSAGAEGPVAVLTPGQYSAAGRLLFGYGLFCWFCASPQPNRSEPHPRSFPIGSRPYCSTVTSHQGSHTLALPPSHTASYWLSPASIVTVHMHSAWFSWPGFP